MLCSSVILLRRKDRTLGMPQVQSTEFSGAAALRMSPYEQFLRLIEIGRLLAGRGRLGRTGAAPRRCPM
jgi:hypothetical protein